MDAKGFLGLMRIENSVMAGIAVAIGFVIAGGFEPGQSIVLALLSAVIITGAGNAVNDYYDRKIDEKNASHRPIPSGKVSERAAFLFSMVLFAMGVAMAFSINTACFMLASLNSLLLFIYARNLKSSVLAGNLAVSYLTASTFVYGALVTGDPTATVLLAALAFLANVGREIIGDIEDMKGDENAGINTLAIKIGEKKAWLFGRICILLAIAFSPLPYLMGIFGMTYLLAVLAADGLFLASVATKDARKNQRLTKIAIFVGLIAFLLGAILS